MSLQPVVLAVPYVPPPPPVPAWRGLRHFWQGWNGTTWEISNPDEGVVLVTGGVGGMNMPTFERYASESPALPGSRHRGARTEDRVVEWPLLVFGDLNSEEWLARDRAFWQTMRPDAPGLWTVVNPIDGTSRSLTCRFRDDGGHTYSRDPLEAGWAVYTVTMLAEQPYWTGATIRSPRWGVGTGTDFFPATGAPPFVISRATNLTNAELSNPGDVEAWPRWTIEGSFDSVAITTNGGTLDVAGGVPAGQTLVINTDPRDQYALLDGVDVSGTVDFDPRPIPGGETVPVEIVVTSPGGSVQASFAPRYFRAL